MRSTFLVGAVAALMAGCATSPESFVSPSPRPHADAYSCAVRKINELGYTMTGGDRDAGFASAEKQTSGLGTQLLSGRKYFDQIVVSIFDGDGSGSTTIRVTAGQGESTAGLFAKSSRSDMNKPSDSGRAAAQEIIGACGGVGAD